MRIKTIEITNYKAFYETYKINTSGKNIFIYGENGSGKSSLYYALKDFFQSSVEDIDLGHLKNIFIKDPQNKDCGINITFQDLPGTRNKTKTYEFSTKSKTTFSDSDTSIRDANRLKSFLTYKKMLDIHHLKKHQRIDLFNLLVKGVLQHFRYSLTQRKELGQLWQEVEELVARPTSNKFKITQKRTAVKAALNLFNNAFGQLFDPASPEYILKHAGPMLEYFKHNIGLNLTYGMATVDEDFKRIENNHVHVELTYAGKKVQKPHLFLNEARLSAIATSIYLGMIKRHPQRIPCKLLFLDDIFIGLDMSNRLPLLEILKKEFSDYQIIITTYDKPWFEYARSYLEQEKGWKTMEFYTEETPEGFEMPRIDDNQDFIKKAEWHFKNCDYKAAAVYARSAFEKALQDYCRKRGKRIIFKPRLKDHKIQDFWDVVKEDIQQDTITAIEQYRALVLNPFSHYDTETHELKTELRGAIDAVKNLKAELESIK
jgi:energy-coupling factor transporter ATP-binding protein EcfA2